MHSTHDICEMFASDSPRELLAKCADDAVLRAEVYRMLVETNTVADSAHRTNRLWVIAEWADACSAE